TPAATTLATVTQVGWMRTEGVPGYAKKAMPTIALEYSKANMSPRALEIDPLTGTLDGRFSRWVDLDAEGLPGILREQSGAWWYQRPVGLDRSAVRPRGAWGRAAVVRNKPNPHLAQGWQLQDVDGDGQVDLAKFDGPDAGVWSRRDGVWSRYRKMRATPNID